jgi:hypothetical protein
MAAPAAPIKQDRPPGAGDICPRQIDKSLHGINGLASVLALAAQ